MLPAALDVLAALLEVGPEGATREHLVHNAGIATSTFYRVLKPLLQKGLVVEADRRYRMPLDNLHNFRFKLWHDAERLYELPPADCEAVLDIAERARQHLRHNLLALWLVGSAARGRFLPESDLDFLAVVREDTDYHPDAHRPVNFVVMTEAQFSRRFAGSDDFVLAALRRGLLLHDAAFARAAYETPLLVALSTTQVEEAQEELERHRRRLLRFAEGDDATQAMAALQALAIKTAWLMLRTMNVFPPPKAELVEACQRYFGHRLAACVNQAVSRRTPLPLRRQVQLAADLHEYHRRFHQHLSHLKAYASLPSAGVMELEQLCEGLFRELFPSRHVESAVETPLPVDVVVRSDAKHYIVIDCRSLTTREMDPQQVVDFKRKAAHLVPSGTRYVMVMNMQRDVPVLERGDVPFQEAVVHAAQEHGVSLITGMDLLQAHNRLHLEELSPERCVTELFAAPRVGGHDQTVQEPVGPLGPRSPRLRRPA